ncbi:MAG TPA: glycosyltransferase family 2 protein [Accumulibacter sp.]|jgi:hypothetical protein|nr:glycosyltransferase family 2 protein [Accumulibacter sp.]HQC79223.1 glycosyltransferase family 2 protein [Accumulibacter sp.]
MSKDTVYVVILNWNGWQDTVICLEHLFKSQGCRFVAVVCDNGSTNDSLQHIEAWLREKSGAFQKKELAYRLVARTEVDARRCAQTGSPVDLVLIDNAENLGFAGGCNVGIRYALQQDDCAHVWLLNNDTVVPPDSMAAMVNAFKSRPSLGLCGSQVRYLEQPELVQSFGGLLNKWFCTTHTLSCGLPASQLVSEPANIDFVPGASMMASRDFLESVGLMYEKYFLYFEEIDWAERAKGKFQIGVCLDSLVYHAGGASIGSPGEAGQRGLRSEYYLLRGRLMFAKRFYPHRLWSVYLGLLASVGTRLRKKQWDRAGIALRVVLGQVPKNLVRT